ncbi:short-chain dehydrogenase [Polyplosphaeria fusca]|uniref:Short-chain dehydrogenase n=1 Tax=Polyplosphaeria fusca TaxID=682080 RepID=A0A9P4V7A1_9PLEO|nr:short-chain dehydrogenase [Polyplosphaeria fusca]
MAASEKIVRERDLEGKVAIVTGATKGIGRAICLDLASRGASILGTYSSPESAHLFDTLSSDITSTYSSTNKPNLVGITADISTPLAPSLIIEALHEHFGSKVDIVVFNAAVMGLAKMGDGKVTDDFVGRALLGNVQFPVMLVEGLVSGGLVRPNGRVVAVSSEGVRARRPAGGKWADELGTRSGMEGTTFNSVSVGFTKTEAYDRIPEGIREKMTAADAAEVAVGNRIGEVEDISDVVGLLVSEKARWISGSVADASGGKAKII